MKIDVCPVPLEEKSILRNLMELYAYDFSEFDDADVDSHGLYGYSYLDHYWTEEGRHALFFKVDDRLAGFAMVRQCQIDGALTWTMAEFFVMRKYRKHGLGRTAAWRIFDQFPGLWNVAELAENLPAQVFWRRIINEYTQGKFNEVNRDDDTWCGPVQVFVSKQTNHPA